LILHNTGFKNLILIENEIISDNRGHFIEVFRNNLVNENIDYEFNILQENEVVSKKNVLRGLHFQKAPFEQSKLIRVIDGKILDVVVDLRKKSNTYGKAYSIELSSDNGKILFIPKGFAHGYLVKSDYCRVIYSVDNYYNLLKQDGIAYNDPILNIDWGISTQELILSARDQRLKNYDW